MFFINLLRCLEFDYYIEFRYLIKYNQDYTIILFERPVLKIYSQGFFDKFIYTFG